MYIRRPAKKSGGLRMNNLQHAVNQWITRHLPADLSGGRESPAVKAGLIRVYGQWDNYRTNFDDFREMYLFGFQLDMRLAEEAGL